MLCCFPPPPVSALAQVITVSRGEHYSPPFLPQHCIPPILWRDFLSGKSDCVTLPCFKYLIGSELGLKPSSITGILPRSPLPHSYSVLQPYLYGAEGKLYLMVIMNHSGSQVQLPLLCDAICCGCRGLLARFPPLCGNGGLGTSESGTQVSWL